MWRNPTSATSEKYIINISTFEDGQPEEFLALLNNFNIAVDETGTKYPLDIINYLRTILYGGGIREFDELASQNHGTTNAHRKHIT